MNRRLDTAAPAAGCATGGVTRRGILKGGAALGLAFVLPACAGTDRSLAAHRGDALVTAPGYVHDLVLRWGDPLFSDAPPLDAAAALRGGLLDVPPGLAARWFGYNCDAVHFFPLEGSADRGIACVNHEYTNEELFLPGAGIEYRDHGEEPAVFIAAPVLVRAVFRMKKADVTTTQVTKGWGA